MARRGLARKLMHIPSTYETAHTAPSAPLPSAECNSTEAFAEYVRTTSAPFRIVGSGTWLHGSRPVAAENAVNTSAIAGVLEYVPGDLTLTARAGTTLAQLDALTAAEGQWLAIDPAGSIQSTLGATVATASYGPLAHGIGRMRDIVLGVEVVTGDGRIVRSGGKVVKNVAGFDLVRLQTGAFGTLGILTEVSVRLRAMPELDETFVIALDSRKQLSAQLVQLRDLTLTALAMELVGGALAEQLGIGNSLSLLVRLGGNETRVNAQRASLATIGTLVPVDRRVWQQLRTCESESSAIARVSNLPTELARSWLHVHDALSTASLLPAHIRASVARGVMRVVIPHPSDATAAQFSDMMASLTRTIAPAGGHVVWEQLPQAVWSTIPSAVNDSISRGLQRAFDPNGRCNAGILGASNA
jgi:FAD/FMN-containing dehydrogenase